MAEAVDPAHRARLLAAASPQSGAWLNAVPVPSLGLKLDQSQLRVAVATRIGAALCRPYQCSGCGAAVDKSGVHGLSCRRVSGRHYRHSAANELLKRALASAGLPSVMEPTGVVRTDGKRPDGMTLAPWRRGRCLVWDFTCVDTLAPSNIPATCAMPGAAAEKAQRAKEAKYSEVPAAFEFQPVAVETLGAWSKDSLAFLKEVGLYGMDF